MKAQNSAETPEMEMWSLRVLLRATEKGMWGAKGSSVCSLFKFRLRGRIACPC